MGMPDPDPHKLQYLHDTVLKKLLAMANELPDKQRSMLTDVISSASKAIESSCPVSSSALLFSFPQNLNESTQSNRGVVWDPKEGCWIVRSYEDNTWLWKDDRLSYPERFQTWIKGISEQQKNQMPTYLKFISMHLGHIGGVQHQRLRRIFQESLNHAFNEGAASKIADCANLLIDEHLDDGEMDLVRDFADPLAWCVMGEILGIPKANHEEMVRAAKSVLGSVTFTGDDTSNNRLEQGMQHLVNFFRSSIEDRSKVTPAGIVGFLKSQFRGNDYTANELISICNQIWCSSPGGSYAITGTLLSLLIHGGNVRDLIPSEQGIRLVVEEGLRCHYASPYVSRVAVEYVNTTSATITPGDLVKFDRRGANHDLQKFDDPEVFNLSRSPNPHIAFGMGMHACPGAQLARMLLREALMTLRNRLKMHRIDGISFNHDPTRNVVTTLPIRFSLIH